MSNIENSVSDLSMILKAHTSMEAVKDDPNALAIEIAKWSPDIIMGVLRQQGTRLFSMSGYFVGAGIDLMNPGLVEGLMIYRLRLTIVSYHGQGWLSLNEYMEYISKLSIPKERGYVYKQLMIKKLQNTNQQCC